MRRPLLLSLLVLAAATGCAAVDGTSSSDDGETAEGALGTDPTIPEPADTGVLETRDPFEPQA